jgi:hypothetical protein
MLLREFINQKELEDVDMLDDLHFFMHNDPKFYRKFLYPLIAKFRDHIKQGKKCKDTVFRPCVDRAVDMYCQKYDIAGNPKSVFTDVDRDELARRVFGQEKMRVDQGVYDGDQK